MKTLIFIATLSAALASASFRPDFIQQIDSVAQALRKCYKIPALSIAIVDLRNASSLAKAYGVRSTSSADDHVTLATKFAIGSVSKSITAAALGLHMDQESAGELSYDTTVQSLMTQHFSHLSQVERYANLRDLLAHRTGHCALDGALVAGSERSRRDLLDNVVQIPAIPSRKSLFRQSFNYNNDMYALAAALVEHESGERFESMVEELLFRPLGMKAKYVNEVDEEVDDDVAMAHFAYGDGTNRSYVMRPQAFEEFRAGVGTDGTYNAPGGVMASAEDMRKYLLFWLTANASTIGKLAFHELNQPQTALPVQQQFIAPPRYSYLDSVDLYSANGLYSGTHRGRRLLMHSGNLGPFSSLLAFLPSEGIGAFVSTSGPGGLIGAFAAPGVIQSVFELLFRGEFHEWGPEKVCIKIDVSALTPHPGPLPRHPLQRRERYEGTYRNPLVGRITVTRHAIETQLAIQFGSIGQAHLALDSAESELLFRMRFAGATSYMDEAIGSNVALRPPARMVEFERGAEEDGRMARVRMGCIAFAGGEPLPMSEQVWFQREI